ncbi:methyltransferase domain-containing protein [Nocardiopsis sp. NPDC006938]|uniref:methyltransferase domain-containing protein n=1 Tax=Nocardiopsis sp. NPDC006938 TaxID=3364337 RepID=UPI0036AA0F0A
MNSNDPHTRLVEALDTSERVRAAFADHPRHRFVPDMIWPGVSGLPLFRSADPERWTRIVYENDAVITQANDGGSGPVNRPSSSSSAPQVMADMIHAAGVGPGMRVLEIGTGTGWNAAILSSLVGPTGSVTSLEIDPKVAEHAAKRLSGTGVSVATGAVPPDGPYDAVIATCAVRRVPEPWTTGLVPEGTIVLPWATHDSRGPTPIVALSAGSPLAGPFVRDGSFMRDRTQRVPPERFPGVGAESEREGHFPLGSEELIDQDRLTRLVLAAPFLSIDLHGHPWREGHASIVALGADDSWTYVWPDGSTTGGGPRDLGRELGEVHTELGGAGWPELTEFALEVSPDRRTHTIRSRPLGPWEHGV